MSWSHDHYPKAHWCGARARNPDVNRCPKSLWCIGLLKAWVSDFDPANSSLPYVHSELISDIMIHIWIHIWYGDHQSSTQSFWIHIWHCWWYVGDMSQMISTLYRCFFLPSFAPQRQRQTRLWSPRLSQQFHTSALTPSYDHQTQGHQCRVKVDSTPAPGFQATKKGMKLMKPTILGDRTW